MTIGELQRTAALEAVRRALTLIGPDVGVNEEARGLAGDAGEIYDNIDGLIQISRRTTADFAEPYMAQVMDEVCTRCRHQFDSGYCPLREAKSCSLDKTILPVFEAIAGALRNTEDPEYIAVHAEGCSACRAGSNASCQCGDTETAVSDYCI